jgi:sterol desaturase/sphingolipid hydroxylase (fatty acid hydroxylase superfamily)
MTREQWLITISIPAYIISILFEIYENKKYKKNNYQLKDSLISLWMGIAGGSLDFLMRIVTLGVLDWCYYRALLIPDLLIYYPVLAWFLVFIAQDFCFYWLHRTEHRSRLFWAVHSNHHSSPNYNFTVALRSSVLQPLYRFVFYIPIAFLGFDGLTIMFMYAVNQFYQFFLHTETVQKLPNWYEAIFVTPSHHRVHHASNEKYLDKNMGQVLIIWDKLFGTFQEETEKPQYGLTSPLNTSHPIDAIFYEFYKIRKEITQPAPIFKKLRFLISPPEKSFDDIKSKQKRL